VGLRLLAPLLAWVVTSGTGVSPSSPIRRADMAARIKAEILHAWRGYERYAWGHDELKPVTKTAHDWHGNSLLMTPVDTLDTLLLAGLDEEAATSR